MWRNARVRENLTGVIRLARIGKTSLGSTSSVVMPVFMKNIRRKSLSRIGVRLMLCADFKGGEGNESEMAVDGDVWVDAPGWDR